LKALSRRRGDVWGYSAASSLSKNGLRRETKILKGIQDPLNVDDVGKGGTAIVRGIEQIGKENKQKGVMCEVFDREAASHKVGSGACGGRGGKHWPGGDSLKGNSTGYRTFQKSRELVFPWWGRQDNRPGDRAKTQLRAVAGEYGETTRSGKEKEPSYPGKKVGVKTG